MNTPVVFLVFLVLAVVAWIAYSARATGRVVKKAEAQDTRNPHVEILRYRLPDGQDPAVLIAALEMEGYEADLEVESSGRYLLVECPSGRDRERARVRNVLAQNQMASLEGPPIYAGRIVFEDEKPSESEDVS